MPNSHVPGRNGMCPAMLLLLAVLTAPAHAVGPFAYVLGAGPLLGKSGISVVNTSGPDLYFTVSTPFNPVAVAVNSTGTRFYVVGDSPRSLTAYDSSGVPLQPPVQLGTLALTGTPTDIVIHPGDTQVTVANPGAARLDVIDVSGSTPTLTTSIPLGTYATYLALTPSGSKLYVSDPNADKVWVLAGGPPTSIPFTVGDRPGPLRLNPAGTRLYVVTQTPFTEDRLHTIDVATDTDLGSAHVGPPTGVTVNRDGTRVVATVTGDAQYVFDATVDPAALLFSQSPPNPQLDVGVTGLVVSPFYDGLYGCGALSGTFSAWQRTNPPISYGQSRTIRVAPLPFGGGNYIGPEIPGTGVTVARATCTIDLATSGSCIYDGGVYNVFGTGVSLHSEQVLIVSLSNFDGFQYDAFVNMNNAYQAVGKVSPCIASDGGPFCGYFWTLEADVTNINTTELPSGPAYRLSGSFAGNPPNLLQGSIELTAFDPGVATPSGSNVTVSTLSAVSCGGRTTMPVTVTYDTVSTAGTTLVTASCNVVNVLGLDIPSGFSLELGNGRRYLFDVSTTAAYSGPVEVCFGYPPDLPPFVVSTLQLLHEESGTFVSVPSTVDTVNHRLCGTVSSLSPFAVAMAGAQEGGFVPPDAATASCEAKASKTAAVLAKALVKCRRAAAKAASASLPVDSTCETRAMQAFDAKAAALDGCPACLAPNLAAVRDGLDDAYARLDGDVYCEGGESLPPSNNGRVPPDANTLRCEDRAEKAAGKLGGALEKCNRKSASAAFKGRPFDEHACKTTARQKYLKGLAKLTGCGCAFAHAMGPLDELGRAYETANADIFCAGTIPLP